MILEFLNVIKKKINNIIIYYPKKSLVNKDINVNIDIFNVKNIEENNINKPFPKNIINEKNPQNILDIHVNEFRKNFNLSTEDFTDDKLKNILKKHNGDFDNAFIDLVSI